MNKKKKDFFQELRDRNVWREIKAYLFGGATIMSLVFLLYESGFIELEEFKLVLIIFFSLFPSVLLFAYHHGESRKAPWSKAEKIGIPLNVTVVFFLVFFYNNEVEATEFEKVLIQNPLTQIMEEREVLKTKYRKRPALAHYYAALLYHQWGKQEKAEEHLIFSLETWKDADDDYIFSNKVKEAAQEWNIEILN